MEERKGGLPGVQADKSKEEEQIAAMLLTQRDSKPRIGEEEIAKAVGILQEYKAGKTALEQRVIDDEQWYQLRHWDVIRAKKDPNAPQPASAWLFNSLLNKHADAMDNYPEPIVLPRERTDQDAAKMLSSVLPVILEENDFQRTYSDAWWDKLKSGTAIYGTFWDPKAQNGLGDVAVKRVDILKLFWQPGILDIQDSRNVFAVELVDTDLLDAQYPQFKGEMNGSVVDLAQYTYDDTVDTSGKTTVVDWYYKVQTPSGKTAVHYVKFAGNVVLYASENDSTYRNVGYYDHGLYPFVFDVLFPEPGTPAGFGMVAVCKDPQLYIDSISADVLSLSKMRSQPRYWTSESTNINREQFLDWSEPLVDVAGELDDRKIRPIEVPPVDGNVLTVMQMKQDEMKETSANRDVNSGGTGSGVTAAAAIAALQEAGNKVSRDMIRASQWAFVEVNNLITELIRQFYDASRPFRITGEIAGTYEFVDVSNAGIKDQMMGTDSMGAPLVRRPVFDFKTVAQKKSPFSRMEQNERAKELYGLGFFNPQRAQEALAALQMMDFEGIDKVIEQVKQGETIMRQCQQLAQQVDQLSQIVQATTGIDMGSAPKQPQTVSAAPVKAPVSKDTDRMMESQVPQTGYAQRLAERSVPSV